MRHKITDGLIGFLVGIALMLTIIQIWGLSWIHILAPTWSPGL